jgi:S-adenosylmethionine synthetase
MPAALHYSHQILRLLNERRKAGRYAGLGPDAKSQVTLVYDRVTKRPVDVHSVVVSTQHAEAMAQDTIRGWVDEVLAEVLPDGWRVTPERLLVNPTGRFVIGGPVGDTGLTGRKIIVDSYGGAAPHGGGAFSGKDPTKVDRSAAYMARYLAKNVVAAGLAERCLIQIAYAIGVARPVSVLVDMMGTGKIPEAEILAKIEKNIDLTPRGIRTHLGLNRPIYRPTATYGHFGRMPTAEGLFPWEKVDLGTVLRA